MKPSGIAVLRVSLCATNRYNLFCLFTLYQTPITKSSNSFDLNRNVICCSTPPVPLRPQQSNPKPTRHIDIISTFLLQNYPITHAILYLLSPPILATGRGCIHNGITLFYSLYHSKCRCLLHLQMARQEITATISLKKVPELHLWDFRFVYTYRTTLFCLLILYQTLYTKSSIISHRTNGLYLLFRAA